MVSVLEARQFIRNDVIAAHRRRLAGGRPEVKRHRALQQAIDAF